MTTLADRLVGRIEERNSVVCVGLDPVLERIPHAIVEDAFARLGRNLEGAAEAASLFCRGLIETVADVAVAVKPQSACFEKLGWQGCKAYHDVCRSAQEAGLLVIADVKRNDIGSTASAYASGYLGTQDLGQGPLRAWPVDAVTVNPYLGRDGIEPFIDEGVRGGTGLFVLVRTSNRSATQFQDLIADGRPVFEHVADWLSSQADRLVGACGYSGLGAVVGATYPDELERLRRLMPTSLFLVPGYGAQGAGATEVAAAFDAGGLGALVNASRSIIYAGESSPGQSWQDAARAAALVMRDDLNRVRRKR